MPVKVKAIPSLEFFILQSQEVNFFAINAAPEHGGREHLEAHESDETFDALFDMLNALK